MACPYTKQTRIGENSAGHVPFFQKQKPGTRFRRPRFLFIPNRRYATRKEFLPRLSVLPIHAESELDQPRIRVAVARNRARSG